MSLAGCQIIPIDLNFHLQKCLDIFDKNSADKIQFKNSKEVNPPCLMPTRVKAKLNIDVFIYYKRGWGRLFPGGTSMYSGVYNKAL